MKRILLALGVLACIAGTANAQAVVTVAETSYSAMLGMKEIVWTWATNAAGTATGPTVDAYVGEIAAFYTVYPVGAGASPTTAYELSVRDSRGVDVLLGQGVGERVGDFTQTYDGGGNGDGAGLGVVLGSILTLYIENAGATKSAVTYLWVRQR